MKDSAEEEKDEEPKIQEITEEEAEEAKMIDTSAKAEEGKSATDIKDTMADLAKHQKSIDLRAIDEGGVDQSTEGKPPRMLLDGFK